MHILENMNQLLEYFRELLEKIKRLLESGTIFGFSHTNIRKYGPGIRKFS